MLVRMSLKCLWFSIANLKMPYFVYVSYIRFILGTLMELVTSANATFQSAWPYWQEVNNRFTTLQSVTERFLLTESIGKLKISHSICYSLSF